MSKIKLYILASISIIVTIAGIVLAYTLPEFFKCVEVVSENTFRITNIPLLKLNLSGAIFLTISSILSIASTLVIVLPKTQKYRPYVFIVSVIVLIATSITIICLKLFNFKFDSISADKGTAIRFGSGCWTCLGCFLVGRTTQILIALNNKSNN